MKLKGVSAFFGDRYRVSEVLGTGGMSTIYKTFDAVRSETAALKKMVDHYVGSPSALLGFKNEFRLMSQFQHPNTVRVYDPSGDRWRRMRSQSLMILETVVRVSD